MGCSQCSTTEEKKKLNTKKELETIQSEKEIKKNNRF